MKVNEILDLWYSKGGWDGFNMHGLSKTECIKVLYDMSRGRSMDDSLLPHCRRGDHHYPNHDFTYYKSHSSHSWRHKDSKRIMNKEDFLATLGLGD